VKLIVADSECWKAFGDGVYMYVGGIAITRGVSSFGTPPSPIFLDNLACDGEESSILACPRSMLGLHQCDHSQDSGVQCFGTQILLSFRGHLTRFLFFL